jgi:hypothetical protein
VNSLDVVTTDLLVPESKVWSHMSSLYNVDMGKLPTDTSPAGVSGVETT